MPSEHILVDVFAGTAGPPLPTGAFGATAAVGKAGATAGAAVHAIWPIAPAGRRGTIKAFATLRSIFTVAPSGAALERAARPRTESLRAFHLASELGHELGPKLRSHLRSEVWSGVWSELGPTPTAVASLRRTELPRAALRPPTLAPPGLRALASPEVAIELPLELSPVKLVTKLLIELGPESPAESRNKLRTAALRSSAKAVLAPPLEAGTGLLATMPTRWTLH